MPTLMGDELLRLSLREQHDLKNENNRCVEICNLSYKYNDLTINAYCISWNEFEHPVKSRSRSNQFSSRKLQLSDWW